jgi:hypothetical protein
VGVLVVFLFLSGSCDHFFHNQKQKEKTTTEKRKPCDNDSNETENNRNKTNSKKTNMLMNEKEFRSLLERIRQNEA